MAQVKTWAAFDVHVSGVVAALWDRDSGELRVQRLPGRSEDVAAFAASLPGPVRATYEAGPTGFVRRFVRFVGEVHRGSSIVMPAQQR
jgi:hypothetical protein